ncbi:MAG: class I SAM-dependent methyltransferase, partial [Planctomycetota bacterium]
LRNRGDLGPRVLDGGRGPGAIAIEICSRHDSVEVMAMDASQEMLDLARFEIEAAGLNDRITLIHDNAAEVDCVQDDLASTVISNTVLHHIPEPIGLVEVAIKACQPDGQIFIRDLCRPETAEQVELIVDSVTGLDSHCSVPGISPQQLLRQSLHAALTLSEIRRLVDGLGIDPSSVQMTSNRHWTLATRLSS